VSALVRLVRHARRYGVAGILEAADDLAPSERAALVEQLRAIDPSWHPENVEEVAKWGQTSPETKGLTVTNRGGQGDSLSPPLARLERLPRCRRCGVRLHPERSTRRYCSNACRQAAYRERVS
jgi:hypothetical protein